MRILVIFNPAAGMRKDNELAMITGFLESQKISYVLHQTSLEKGPYEILSKITEKFDVILTCGGDGTVSQTIRGLHTFNFNIPVLIVPLGTSNEVAHNLGLKKDSLISVLNRLNMQDIVTLDYGIINDNKTFTYALTFGNFTEVTYKTPQKMKNWLGYRAYMLYGFLSFRRIKTYRVKFGYNQTKLSGNYLFGSISNSSTIGNIFHYDNESMSLCDGKFEVLLISRPKNVKELRLILIGLRQNDYDNEMFTTFKAENISVSSKVSIDWNIDGEFAGTYKEIEIKNLHKSIQLIV